MHAVALWRPCLCRPGRWQRTAATAVRDRKSSSAVLGATDGRQREALVPVPVIGSCLESVFGGNHLRAWKQNGTDADTCASTVARLRLNADPRDAWFLAASQEKDSRSNHDVAENGYDRGRDRLVHAASRLKRWRTHVHYLEGLLRPGNEGLNVRLASRLEFAERKEAWHCNRRPRCPSANRCCTPCLDDEDDPCKIFACCTISMCQHRLKGDEVVRQPFVWSLASLRLLSRPTRDQWEPRTRASDSLG
jgi:hypothetical protein